MVFTEAEPDDPTFIMLVSNDPSVAVNVPGDFRIVRYGTRIWHMIYLLVRRF